MNNETGTPGPEEVNAPEGAVNMAGELTEAGILMPHLGAIARREVDRYGPWHWGNAYLDPIQLYSFEMESVADRLRLGHMFVLAHAGHGVNSYALNLLCSAGPIAVLVQHLYGGGYADPLQATLAINRTYTRLHYLMRQAVKHDDVQPSWLMTMSNFRGPGGGLLDLRAKASSEGFRDRENAFDDEPSLFKATAAKIPNSSLEEEW